MEGTSGAGFCPKMVGPMRPVPRMFPPHLALMSRTTAWRTAAHRPARPWCVCIWPAGRTGPPIRPAHRPPCARPRPPTSPACCWSATPAAERASTGPRSTALTGHPPTRTHRSQGVFAAYGPVAAPHSRVDPVGRGAAARCPEGGVPVPPAGLGCRSSRRGPARPRPAGVRRPSRAAPSAGRSVCPRIPAGTSARPSRRRAGRAAGRPRRTRPGRRPWARVRVTSRRVVSRHRCR